MIKINYFRGDLSDISAKKPSMNAAWLSSLVSVSAGEGFEAEILPRSP